MKSGLMAVVVMVWLLVELISKMTKVQEDESNQTTVSLPAKP